MKKSKKEQDKEFKALLDDSRKLLKKWEFLADEQAKKQGVVFEEEKQ